MIHDQLCNIVGSLRQLEPDPVHQFIETKRRTFLVHQRFQLLALCLDSVVAPSPKGLQDPYRHLLPDDGKITFTQADLYRGNLVISKAHQLTFLPSWTGHSQDGGLTIGNTAQPSTRAAMMIDGAGSFMVKILCP
ncbi:hypothetical protein NUU61_002343 [Penicillium alfredii]|uniref:Uncharacterized protein n=1 Tax=Penicillium alfredii TaxID=1506179 RepID=A0A9W9FRC3_9EURO|nr:uncharacterized protein NUU61_002343 [Penicillium alfredii]KAJ5104996.1 hypothetical protein NUU61_002343 [Penicillium alfredii]